MIIQYQDPELRFIRKGDILQWLIQNETFKIVGYHEDEYGRVTLDFECDSAGYSKENTYTSQWDSILKGCILIRKVDIDI